MYLIHSTFKTTHTHKEQHNKKADPTSLSLCRARSYNNTNTRRCSQTTPKMQTMATTSSARFPCTAPANLLSSSRQRRMRCFVPCTLHPARRRAGRVVDDDNNTNTVCARSKKSHRESPRDSLREPPPQTPLEEAVEETLYDGRHVLVVLDKHGARLYRTQIASEAWKLEPLINYNHRGECSSSSIIVERGKSFSVWFCCFLSSLTKKERSDDRPVPFIVS